MQRKLIVLGILVLGVIMLAACATPTPQTVEVTRQVEVTREVQVTSVVAATAAPAQPTAAPAATMAIPNMDAWTASGHNDAKAVAFTHWNAANPAQVPTSCAKCHTSAGFIDFATNGKVTQAVAAPAGTITCATCHNPAAEALTTVTFPSGKVITTTEEGEGLCMQCHQGRESKVSVDKQIATFKATDPDVVVPPMKDSSGNTVNFGFLNVHYFAAGATLYGSQAQMGYEYDGKSYDPKFRHVPSMDTCLACHDQHATTVRVDKCGECHQGVKTVDDLKNIRQMGSTVDYNGNGNTTEGIAAEMAGLQDILMGSIQAYANDVAKTPIVYDSANYPYFMVAGADGKETKDAQGNLVGYNAWTPRLLKAAFNYQVSAKDPGAFAHNAKYDIELLYDSIADLNTKLAKPVDMSKMRRDDAAHFAGDTPPFRDWDATGEVPAGCARCHSSAGLPMYLHNGGTLFLTSNGSLQVTGVVAVPTTNGFQCSTCHDESNFPNRLAVSMVTFPSGAKLTFSTEKDAQGNLKPVDANLCLECHQGRESTVSVNAYLAPYKAAADTPDPKIGFKNVHYFAAGATLFGDAAKGAYEYDGQQYVGQNTQHPLNKCTDCHDAHALTVKLDACKQCHGDVTDPKTIRATNDTTDWNGNGDTKEPIAKEIATFQDRLYAGIQKYATATSKTPIVYDPASYPYFFVAGADGKAVTDAQGNTTAYNAWTPRLLRAAYNYQYSVKDPGVFAHNPMYVMQFLYDSTKDIGGDVTGLTRPPVGK
jgi:hypothetical protein